MLAPDAKRQQIMPPMVKVCASHHIMSPHMIRKRQKNRKTPGPQACCLR